MTYQCTISVYKALALTHFFQDTTVAELMKKQERMMTEQGGMIREQGVMMKKIDDQELKIRELGEMIRRLEKTLKQYTEAKSA